MTDEERREVAARLRWIDARDDPGNTALMLDKIRRAIGVHMDAPSVFPPYEWLVTYAHVTLNRLADLIEPEERRCYVECVKSGPFYDVFRFDCCGKEYSESRTDDGATELPLAVCPFCGARVIQE